MRKILFATLLITFLVSCTKDLEHSTAQSDDILAKIINTSEGANEGSLLVKLHSYEAEFLIDNIAGTTIDAQSVVPVGRATAEELQTEELYRWWKLSFDKDVDVEKVAHALAADSRIAFIEYNTLVEPISSESVSAPMPTRYFERPSVDMPFNDPELSWQWHYYNDAWLNKDYGFFTAGADINLFDAWKYTTGDRRIIVGVLDGGIYYDHEDLKSNIWVNEAEQSGSLGFDDDNNGYVDDIYGYNFYHDSAEIDWEETQMRSHGTHVAGTIAAVNDNGYCGSGIAGGSGKNDGCRMMICQIFYNGNGAPESSIAAAIKYAADNGAVIINNSWSYSNGAYSSDSRFNSSYSILMDAFRYYEENAGLDGLINGGLMIFAAGNDGSSIPSYPGAYYDHICVTAMGPDFKAASYTNYGVGANICAPGGEGGAAGYGTIHRVSSTSLDSYGYEYMQGTSMATPHVTGCAALGLSYALQIGRSFTLDEYKNLILTSVHNIDVHQTGTKNVNKGSAGMQNVDLSIYAGKLGSGYIDAHLLLMQIEGTPCIYIEANSTQGESLANYFGGGSESLTYTAVEMSSADMDNLGITTRPTVTDGKLVVKATKRGRGRISVTAIVGGDKVGGGDNMGGVEVTREFEIVVRNSTANNGGWL